MIGRQQDIPQTAELFTAYLGSSKNTSDTSFYTFGYIDQGVVTASGGEIQYTDVDNSQGFWMFASTTAQVNGSAVNASGNTAIADTGTTLALVSDALCKAIYAAIPGSKLDQQQQVSSDVPLCDSIAIADGVRDTSSHPQQPRTSFLQYKSRSAQICSRSRRSTLRSLMRVMAWSMAGSSRVGV